MKTFLSLLLALCLLAACSPPAAPTPPPTEPPPSPQALLLQRAVQTLAALKAGDMNALAALTHPTRGVRFSPYPYVQDSQRVYLPAELPAAAADPALYLWGNYDGTGDPINLSFRQYFDRFVWDQDYLSAPQIGVNVEIGKGNSINNIPDYYPGASYVEFHFPGFNPEYNGMDWVSLRLVFVYEGGDWLLVGIVHGAWTI